MTIKNSRYRKHIKNSNEIFSFHNCNPVGVFDCDSGIAYRIIQLMKNEMRMVD